MSKQKPSQAARIIELGRLGSAYGVHGWLRFDSFTQPADNILNYHHWLMQSLSGDWQPVDLVDIKRHQQRFVVKLSAINTPEQARLLTNRLIGVGRQALPELAEHEYYWSDLIGLEVLNEQGQSLGVIDHLFATGANDVIVVKQGRQEVLIPYHESVVQCVDLSSRCIKVVWDVD